MRNKFDELAKGLAQSVTRRQALKRFGVGLAGIVLACFGKAIRARAQATFSGYCQVVGDTSGANKIHYHLSGTCVDLNNCFSGLSKQCSGGVSPNNLTNNCGSLLDLKSPCSF